MTIRTVSVRALLIALEALALALVFLYLGEYFGWRWVREASGLVSGSGPAVFASAGTTPSCDG